MEYEVRFLWALLTTIVVETAILVGAVRVFLKNTIESAVSMRILILTGIVCSSLTLPYVWLVLPGVIHDRALFMIVSEGFAFVVEAGVIVMLLKSSVRDGLVLSFLCNAGSFMTGLFLHRSIARDFFNF